MPKISCILPVNKDTPPFLDKAVESILNQSFTDFELIIVANDCSNELWCKTQTYSDPRVQSIRLKIGQLPFALNYGIEKAQGEYIARMDADDISHPKRFELQLQFLEKNKEISILGTQIQAINSNGEEVRFKRKIPLSNNHIQRKLPITNPLIHPTIMARKEFFIKMNGYQGSNLNEDYEMWLRARRVSGVKFANISDKLLYYRIHQNQLTSSNNMLNILDINLKTREFLYTKNPRFIIGIVVSLPPIQLIIKLVKKLSGTFIKTSPNIDT